MGRREEEGEVVVGEKEEEEEVVGEEEVEEVDEVVDPK